MNPGETGWITASTPVTRYYGDMAITIGNTTVVLKDIYVDTPRPKGQAIFTLHGGTLHSSTPVQT